MRVKTKIRKGKGNKMSDTKAVCCGGKTPVPVSAKPSGVTGHGFVNGVYVAPSAAPSFWETDIEVIKSCGVLGQKVKVYITPKARQKLNVLMGKFTRMEWLAYLVGNKATNTVEDIIIPKQRVSVVKVNVDGQVNIPIMGVIHSHHDMGNKFSHTDDEYINQNHDISLCISHTGVSGHVRVKTECNRYALVQAEVVEAVTEFDVTEFHKEIDDMITVQEYFTGYYGKTGPKYLGLGDMDELIGGMEGLEDYSDLDQGAVVVHGMGGDLMEEIDAYVKSIDGVDVDAFYQVEMDMLINLIGSIGKAGYAYWEDKAFKGADNVYTEDYYRLIDEISASCESMSEREMVALNHLSLKLQGMMKKVAVA